MREPRFWRDDGVAAKLLAPLAGIYAAVVARRMTRPGTRVGVPVVCVGDFTVGGAGKTPVAIAIAQLMQANGATPFLLSRGYGGALSGPVRVEATHPSADVGDEALLLARAAPTVVARDRLAGAQFAAAAGATAIVMDDGLQNPALAKDISIAVIDGVRGIGNGHVIPAGPLRAPLVTQLAQTDALIVLGEASTGLSPLLADARKRGLPVLAGRLTADEAAIAALKDRKVLAFAGIGHPEKFFAMLLAHGVTIAAARSFADHHRYTAAEAGELLTRAAEAGMTLATTEKDLARMQGAAHLAALAGASIAVPVTAEFADSGAAARLVLERPKRLT